MSAKSGTIPANLLTRHVCAAHANLPSLSQQAFSWSRVKPGSINDCCCFLANSKSATLASLAPLLFAPSYSLRPTASAITRSSPISFSNCSRESVCAASEAALSGLG